MPRQDVGIDYERIFQATTTACAILSPDMRILGVNQAYLGASGASHEEIVGRGVFDAFPDRPTQAEADFAQNLRGSVERAIATRRPDTMAVFRYDLPTATGLEKRFWSVINIPVFGVTGEVTMLLHRAEDVCDLFRRLPPDRVDARVTGDAGPGERGIDLALLARSHEAREANRRLGEVKRRLERAVDEQALVAALGQRALSAGDEGELLERALSTVRRMPDVDFCEVLERRDGDVLVARATAGWPADEDSAAAVEARAGSFVRSALEAADPVVVDDVGSDDRFPAPERLVRHSVTSAATVRLGDPGEPRGILAAYSRVRGAFTAADGLFLLTVANVLAAGLERRRHEAATERQALHDDPTGVPSRRLLLDRLCRELAHACRTGEAGALVLIDLDNFKGVNDTFGTTPAMPCSRRSPSG